MQNYRVQLKAQAFLDEYVLDSVSTHVVCVDLMGHAWSLGLFRSLTDQEWRALDACVLLNPRDESELIIRDMCDRGFRLGGRGDKWILMVRNELPFDLRVVCTDGVPHWKTLREQLATVDVVVGSLGIDRHKMGLLASRALNLRHAWTLGDVNSKRWVDLAPDYGYGLFTTLDAQFRTVCYVSSSVRYADCRPMQSNNHCLLYCRIVLDVPEERHGLPLSMQLRHTQFKDHMDIDHALDDEDTPFIQVFHALTQNEEVVKALRFIRKRNHHPNQPRLNTIEDRFSEGTWDLIWMWQLAKLENQVVFILPRGDLLLAAVRARYCY